MFSEQEFYCCASFKVFFLPGTLPEDGFLLSEPPLCCTKSTKVSENSAVRKPISLRGWPEMSLLLHLQSRTMPLGLQNYNIPDEIFSNFIAGAPLRHFHFNLDPGLETQGIEGLLWRWNTIVIMKETSEF